jgi:hypothetical protein
MNSHVVRPTLDKHLASEGLSGRFSTEDCDPPEPAIDSTKLTAHDIRRLYMAAPSAQARALAIEIYRLRGLIGRAAQYLRLAKERGMEQSLEITSRNLLLTLTEALEREPAVAEQAIEGRMKPPGFHRQTSAPAGMAEFAGIPEGKLTPLPEPAAPESPTRYRQRLFTWKLLPQPGRGAEAWNSSRYRGVVIVRAHDPLQARKLAAEKLSAATHSGSRPQSSPWHRRSLVRVELIPEDTAYDRICSPSVVYP